jgi:proteasome inhibitor subunit 1 (PI31)
LDVTTEDYTSESFFPYDTSSSDQPLVHGFISSTRFNDFIKAYKLNILQKLIPGLNKPGYEDNSGSAGTRPSTSSNPERRQQQRPRHNIDDDDTLYADVGGSDLNPLGGGLRLPG